MGDSTILLSNGVWANLNAVSRSDVSIEVIAHALSQLCRFAGHTREFYSVAQHSVLVSERCLPADARWGLLHDAAEAFVGDLVHPVKSRYDLVAYRELEARIQAVICDRFGLPRAMPVNVARADRLALLAEQRDLLPVGPGWRVMEDPPPPPIGPCWSAREAEARFLERYGTLFGGHEVDELPEPLVPERSAPDDPADHWLRRVLTAVVAAAGGEVVLPVELTGPAPGVIIRPVRDATLRSFGGVLTCRVTCTPAQDTEAEQTEAGEDRHEQVDDDGPQEPAVELVGGHLVPWTFVEAFGPQLFRMYDLPVERVAQDPVLTPKMLLQAVLGVPIEGPSEDILRRLRQYVEAWKVRHLHGLDT